MKTLWVISALALSLGAFGQTSSLGSGTTAPTNPGLSNQSSNSSPVFTQPSIGAPSMSTGTNSTIFGTPSDAQRMEDVNRTSVPSSNAYGGAMGGSNTPSNNIPSTTPTGSGTGIGSGTNGMGTGVGAPTSNAP